MNFTDLPDEILVHICAFTTRDISQLRSIAFLARSCSQLHQLLTQPILWHAVCVLHNLTPAYSEYEHSDIWQRLVQAEHTKAGVLYVCGGAKSEANCVERERLFRHVAMRRGNLLLVDTAGKLYSSRYVSGGGTFLTDLWSVSWFAHRQIRDVAVGQGLFALVDIDDNLYLLSSFELEPRITAQGVFRMTVGERFAFAITSNQRLRCWNVEAEAVEMKAQFLPYNLSAIALACNANTYAVVCSSNTVWIQNDATDLQFKQHSEPFDVRIRSVAVSRRYVMVVLMDGSLWRCLISRPMQYSRMQTFASVKVRSLTTSKGTTCVLSEDGEIFESTNMKDWACRVSADVRLALTNHDQLSECCYMAWHRFPQDVHVQQILAADGVVLVLVQYEAEDAAEYTTRTSVRFNARTTGKYLYVQVFEGPRPKSQHQLTN